MERAFSWSFVAADFAPARSPAAPPTPPCTASHPGLIAVYFQSLDKAVALGQWVIQECPLFWMYTMTRPSTSQHCQQAGLPASCGSLILSQSLRMRSKQDHGQRGMGTLRADRLALISADCWTCCGSWYSESAARSLPARSTNVSDPARPPPAPPHTPCHSGC